MSADFLHSLSIIGINIFWLAVKLIPILIAAVFLAEMARSWLGEERLRKLLAGSRPWEGKFRAAFLGAVLPFCECGAFPLMVALLRAGVPLHAALTFFVISPIVSVPAFLFLIAIFGVKTAVVYLVMTVILGLVVSSLLVRWGSEEEILKKVFHRETSSCSDASCGESLTNSKSCCDQEEGEQSQDRGNSGFLSDAWIETRDIVYHILPFAGVAIVFAAVLQSVVPESLIEGIFSFAAPFDVPAAAAAGVPIYTGDCTMIALVAPFIQVTGAVGSGMAFIIAGAGTSINGLVFMSSIFNRKFLIFFVLSIFLIAVLAGYGLNLVL